MSKKHEDYYIQTNLPRAVVANDRILKVYPSGKESVYGTVVGTSDTHYDVEWDDGTEERVVRD